MDTFLLIVGTAGLIIVSLAAYVFTVAARNYVSEDPAQDSVEEFEFDPAPDQRSEILRRQTEVSEFPITVAGEVIDDDRRSLADRRKLH